MDIGAILIGLAILVLAVPYVASPFRKQTKSSLKREKGSDQKTNLGDLKQQEESALKKLRDLDFDYQTGKITPEDYQPLRSELVAEAANLIEAVRQDEARFEERLRVRREAKARKGSCPTCGGPLTSEDSYCPTCGQPVVTTCPNCGKTIQVGDLFCSGCGLAVKRSGGTAPVSQA